MPIYEYECASCAKIHEVTQKITEAPLRTCPDCGAEVRKLISRTSFALNGSGYYSTDYKKAPAPVASSASAPAQAPAPPPTCANTGQTCAKPECAT